MPVFIPIVFFNLPPVIVVTMSGNVTYQQFKESLGNFVYKVNKIYLYSQNFTQIKGNFFYTKYDSDGRQNNQTVVSAIDPFQDQPSIYLDTKNKGLTLDGRNTVQFKVQPLTTLQIKLYADQRTNQDDLNKLHLNNFRSLENSDGDEGFFEDYQDYI